MAEKYVNDLLNTVTHGPDRNEPVVTSEDPSQAEVIAAAEGPLLLEILIITTV
jgi:hypothetical protein